MKMITSTLGLFCIQSFYVRAIPRRVFYVQVFYVQSSAFSLSTKSRSTFCRTIAMYDQDNQENFLPRIIML